MRWLSLLTALAVASGSIACQPKGVRPGLWVPGEAVEERVEDWSFTDDIEEIFIETRPWYGVPHSTTIWCVDLNGKLYIGSSGDKKKAWERNIARNPEARLAIQGKIYEVRVVPVIERDRIEALDAAYTQKYDMVEVFGEEVPDWRYYHVAQRGPHYGDADFGVTLMAVAMGMAPDRHRRILAPAFALKALAASGAAE